MPQSTTFYWYDYETFGLNTIKDRPAQFAGQRTTLDFEPMGEAEVLYCKPSPEYLPSVLACVLTGITPKDPPPLPEPEPTAEERLNDIEEAIQRGLSL